MMQIHILCTILLGMIVLSSSQADAQSTQSISDVTTDAVSQGNNGTLAVPIVNFTSSVEHASTTTAPLETTAQFITNATSATTVGTTKKTVNNSTTTSMAASTPATEAIAPTIHSSEVNGSENQTLDEQMNINISTSATLFSGSLDEQITQTTNLTTTASPASPSTAEEDLQEETTQEQLNTEHTDGNTSLPQNLTQNIISSNVSQNMTTDELEASTNETFTVTASNYPNDTQTATDETLYGNTTAGGLNNSQSLPNNTADFYNATTVGEIISNSTMENETSMFNESTTVAPIEVEILPSQSFQNSTFQATSQTPKTVNLTSSHSENVTTLTIANDASQGTTNYSVAISENHTTDFSHTTESAFNVSTETQHSPTSDLASPTYSTTHSVSTHSLPAIETTTSTLSTGVTNGSVTEKITTESPDATVHEHFTTVPPWDDDITTGGVTTGGLPGGTVSEGEGQKSDAVAVAIGVIVGLLLVAALIIIFMLVRRRVVHGGKRKHLKDEENVNDFHVELRPPPTKPPRNLSRIADIASHKHRNGTVRPPSEAHDNIALDEYSAPTNKNYFQHGLESEAIKEALEDLKDYQLGGSGSTVKMREKPAYPMRAISTKSRISVGPVLMEDDDPSTQNIYDKVYTHNTFKHGK